jgi:adenosylcobinamide-GDP ribazoletransferase
MLIEPLNEAKQTPPSGGGALARPLVCLAAAMQFLTVLPALVRRPFRDAEMGGAVAWFSTVGLGLGGALFLADEILLRIFPPVLASALVLAIWVVLTGALHLDGFLDTCDGLFGGRTSEDRLRIMRDEHVGAYAVIGAVLLILVKFLSIFTLPLRGSALLLAPVLGRTAIAVALVAFPYARESGLGRSMKDHATWTHAGFTGVVALGAAWWLAGPTGLVTCAAVVAFALLAGAFVCRRIPGLTGDIYGALCELAEVLTLLILIAGDRA